MKTKYVVLSLEELQIKMKNAPIEKLPDPDLEDHEIDFSDSPALTEEELKNAICPGRPLIEIMLEGKFLELFSKKNKKAI